MTATRRARVASAVVLASLLAACPSDTPAPGPTGSATLEPTPVPQGAITVAYPYEPPTLDPFTFAGLSPATRDLVRLVMPSLERAEGDTRAPWLLASEPVVREAPRFTVTLSLRDDAVWSDGERIGVDDLRATWRHAVAQRGPASDGYDQIARIVAETPTRARIEFRRPFERWRELFNDGLGVLPAHVRRARLARAWPVSGGPFELTRWRPGLDMVFERSRRPWGERARLRAIRVVFVPDATAALELLRRGEVDVLGPYHAIDWQRRVAEEGAASTVRSSTWAALVFNARFGAVRAAEVRRAFADAVDRARIARGLVQSEGFLLLEPGTTPGLEPVGSARGDLPASRAAVGAREPTFTLAVVAEDDLSFVVAEALKYQALRVGFSFETIALEPDRFWGEWLRGPEFEAALVLLRGGAGQGPRALFGARGIARLRDERLAASFARADGTIEPAGPEPYAERLARLAPVVPLYQVAVTLTAGPDVTDVAAGPTPEGVFARAHEWAAA